MPDDNTKLEMLLSRRAAPPAMRQGLTDDIIAAGRGAMGRSPMRGRAAPVVSRYIRFLPYPAAALACAIIIGLAIGMSGQTVMPAMEADYAFMLNDFEASLIPEEFL